MSDPPHSHRKSVSFRNDGSRNVTHFIFLLATVTIKNFVYFYDCSPRDDCLLPTLNYFKCYSSEIEKTIITECTPEYFYRLKTKAPHCLADFTYSGTWLFIYLFMYSVTNKTGRFGSHAFIFIRDRAAFSISEKDCEITRW